MSVVLAGLLTGLSLIVAIGAQNAYVLRLGLARHFVGLAVCICASADVVLILLGIGGIGRLIRAVPEALQVIKWVGVVYLIGYALHSFWRARRSEVLLPSEVDPPTRRVVAGTMLAFTLLNPHVYLDTVLLVGSIGNQYGHQRWLFAAGASAASILWFTTLGFGARALSRFMSRPITWRILDVIIGVVMLAIAVSLILTPIAA
jgi:L-lysine exporter family protein LysE/ArgO